MKKRKMLCTGLAMGTMTLLLGAQSSFALKCEGSVYFQPPKSWTEAYLYSSGSFTKLKETDGWYAFDALTTGSSYETKFVFSGNGLQNPSMWLTKSETHVTTQLSQEDTLKTMFTCDDFKGKKSLYIYTNPTDPSKTVMSDNSPNVKRLHVLLPANNEWMSSTPMLTQDGTYKGAKPLTVDTENCGWFTYTWMNQQPTNSVLLVRDDDPNMIDAVGDGGVGFNGAAPKPLMVASIFELLGGNDLYFVMDDSQWSLNANLAANKGFTAQMPSDVSGECSYSLASIIYDTDASLHPSFSCWSSDGEGCQNGAQGVSKAEAIKAIEACYGVTQGLVETKLGADGKPVLSKKGKECFIDEKYFNQLFRYTEGVNEVSCLDIPLTRSFNGKWEFDSDYLKYEGTQAVGGFFPVEKSTDASILKVDPNQKPVPAARTKYTAEGPVFYSPDLRAYDEKEGARKIDLVCNGPGWQGGNDCEGKFNNGSNEEMGFISSFLGKKQSQEVCVFGWSCTDLAPDGWTFYKEGTETSQVDGTIRWTSTENAAGTGGRNQLFCSESHAKFVYKPGQRLSLVGDDDIWVFIDKMLAVDIGGLHLAAPGYVDLDGFKGKSGSLVPGESYDLDIFLCNRRTTMSDLRINTNIYPEQSPTSLLIAEKVKKDEGWVSYELVYYQKSKNPCIFDASENYVPDSAKFKKINYHVENVNKEFVIPAENMAESKVYCGGIDLTSRSNPVINVKNIQGCDLKPGKYKLVAEVDGATSPIEFRVVDYSSDVLPNQKVRLSSVKISLLGRSIEMSLDKARADYSVMDVQGRIIARGVLQSRATVAVPMAGTYFVKVGSKVQQVIVH